MSAPPASRAAPRVFLVSYPGPTWRILGAQNFRSATRASTSARGALQEWLNFTEVLAARGAFLLPVSPPLVEPPLTGLLYAANHGHLFARPGAPPLFLVSRMSVPHRALERGVVRGHMEALGFETAEIASRWEGQAEITTLPGGRFILTWGVRSDRESVDEVAALLPADARVLVVRLRAPFFHGDTCLNLIEAQDGRAVLLAHEGALVDTSIGELARFCEPDVEVLPVTEADALNYACNALPMGQALIAPPGLSAELRGQLDARGVTLLEVLLGELFGKGGGGPRCLVNELRGIDARALGALDWRPAVVAQVAGYPKAAEEDPR